jgi:hypothetical protein
MMIAAACIQSKGLEPCTRPLVAPGKLADNGEGSNIGNRGLHP